MKEIMENIKTEQFRSLFVLYERLLTQVYPSILPIIEKLKVVDKYLNKEL